MAADETGVPFDVLMAISLTETGRKQNGRTTAWPWTVNTEGKGTWFDDYGAALSYARQSQAAGARSFDVGCFQINYRWHGQHFASLDAMFDPLVNARYAARFLSNLHAEYGDWQQAAGAFHSRTEVHAARYRKIFAGFRSEIGQDAGGYIPDQPPARQVTAIVANAFPLLRTGASRGGGSLVPLDAAPRPLFDLGG
ncbi:transglycosylase, Slt family protein [Oceaniovalibus guishaninsula JLT2003]|uniref:Transglycosylase, Slt family protein n=1 Tax=Oceaniovalibus guishaninsula JLT2003 TaxID=1231392 RepID=K2HAR8_9RHOB|nr:transglycosylase SLT domain-containing protein [Oceaniovalibus guishaninsula]EKE43767.1 transglycosylase, Slt family protein [Oceaniovalibus guishaninsula JLT2003]